MFEKSAAWSPFDFPLVIRRRGEGAGEIRDQPPLGKAKTGGSLGFSRKKAQKENAERDQILDSERRPFVFAVSLAERRVLSSFAIFCG